MTARERPLTYDQAVELGDPHDCLAPGTRHGKLPAGAPSSVCLCYRHRQVRRARNRDWRRKRRGGPVADGLGVGWIVGVNALPFGPLEAKLVRAGMLPPAEEVHAQRMVELGHPFPDEVHLLARARARGWVTLHEADRICVRVLQLHPALVYGQAWHSLETGESL